MGAIDIRENQINARVLRVGVEPGAATAEQQAALDAIIVEGQLMYPSVKVQFDELW